MKSTVLTVTFVIAILIACGPGNEYPIEKKYWDPTDYDQVLHTIEFLTPEGERYPSLQNSEPEIALVFKKLTDTENVRVVAEDQALGIRHRSEFMADMFSQYNDMTQIYSVMDREDKFIYDRELVEILKYGLFLQIHYFKLGNEKIRQESDDPTEPSVKNLLKRNEETLSENYNVYLDFINRENSFSKDAIKSYVEGINTYFPKLMSEFPYGDYPSMLNKVNVMLKKASNENLVRSLNQLKTNLEEKIAPAQKSIGYF